MHHSGASELTPFFQWGSSYSILIFCVMFCKRLFVIYVPFLLSIVLSVLLLFTSSDYPFSIFSIFLDYCFYPFVFYALYVLVSLCYIETHLIEDAYENRISKEAFRFLT